MFGRLSHWAIAGAALSGLAMRVLATPGYLPVVGPVALRFLAPAQPVTNQAQTPLPPPVAPPVNPPPPAEVAVKTSAPAPSAPPAAPPADTNPPVDLSTSAPAATSSPPDPMISTQSLLKFFNRSTNGPSSAVIAPMNFAPPASAIPPSSSATYSTSPN